MLLASDAGLPLIGLAAIGLLYARVIRLRGRLEQVASAEHELRGAATAIGLAAERLESGGSIAELGPVMRLELARMGAALEELGGRPIGSSSLDVQRLAQVLGNVVANAAEHGVGPVDVAARRDGGVVRLELLNVERPRGPGAGWRAGQVRRSVWGRRAGRGRGIAIAKRAARSLGGRVRVESEGGATRTVIELPVEEQTGDDLRGDDRRRGDDLRRDDDLRRADDARRAA
jgi:C4-dicarboxylate-specific signal transduction histidine kinase